MKILAGKFRGRGLASAHSPSLRPTGDKARMALTNILKDRIIGAKVLDLFCGTGAVGLEFFSAGADSVVFVDSDSRHLALARANASRLGVEAQCLFVDADFSHHDRLRVIGGGFDLIFADPPYDSLNWEVFLDTLKSLAWVRVGSLAVLEIRSGRSGSLPAKHGFTCLGRKNYGDSEFLFFEYNGDLNLKLD